MAIILDLPEYRTMSGLQSVTDADRDAALQMILREVNDVLTRAIRQPLETATYTEYYNAPITDQITLRQWPVTAVTTVKVAPWSGGDPSKFTSDTLITQYTDWLLEVDQVDGSSRCGVIRNLKGWWGSQQRFPMRRLGFRLDPDYRAVQVVYVAGYVQIPQSLKACAQLMAARLYQMRRTGQLVGSASLNGGSYSNQGTAAGMLSDPVISEFLTPFNDIFVGSQ